MRKTLHLTLLLSCAIAPMGCNEDTDKEERDILPILIDESLYKYHFEATQDPFEFEVIQLKEDLLNIVVSYIGGCGAHEFSLIASEIWAFSNPPVMFTVLTHSSDPDTCNTRVSNDLFFNLEPFREEVPFSIAIHNGPGVLYDHVTQ